jgi:DNA polymerase
MSEEMTREEYLLEMGLGPIWVLRNGSGQTASAEVSAEAPEGGAVSAVSTAAPAMAAADAEPPRAAQAPKAAEPMAPAAPSAPVVASSEADFPANEMPDYGPEDWVPPIDMPGWLNDAEVDYDVPETAAPVDPRAAAIARMDWDELEASIAACRACALCQKRKQAVPGVGDRRPDWLLIGEGPGADEDERGEPFVGQAGKLLDNMLAAIDLKRGDKVYIANAVKCRPPGNRTPEAGEIAACWPYLKRQIELAKPKLMLLMGRAAVTSVLANDSSIASLRGKRQSYGEGVTTVVTYHPAYLLRNLPDKAKAWEDLCFARGLLAKQP